MIFKTPKTTKESESRARPTVPWTGYPALFLVCCIFSGWFAHIDEWYGFLDFSTFLGSFGTVGEATFVGVGGTGARHAFLYVLSLAPGVMLALGIVAVAEYYGALLAADRLLNPLLRPGLGIPGAAGLALIASLQSTDAGAAMTHDLKDKKRLSEKELTIFATFQFSSGGSVVNYITTGIALFPFLPVSFLKPLAVILICKIVGANLMRLYLSLCRKEDAQ